MEASSVSSSYSDILTDLLTDSVRDIRKNAILSQQGNELAISTSVADDIASALKYGGYQPDVNIPEGSTLSFHV